MENLLKRKRGRPKGSKKTFDLPDHRKVVEVKCIKCKTVSSITTTTPKIYTSEVRKNYVCVLCKGGK